MTPAFNGGIFKTLVTANQWSCDFINSFIGSLGFNKDKSNDLQQLKEQVFGTELYIDIQKNLPSILHHIPKEYSESNYQNAALWIQRVLYRINLSSFIRCLELNDIYSAGKFSFHHVSPEKELRNLLIQSAFVDLRTRLSATLIMDKVDKSSSDILEYDATQLLAQILPLDGAAFGLYPNEDQDSIVGLVKIRRETIAALPSVDDIDALVTATGLMKTWRTAIITSMYGISEFEMPSDYPPTETKEDDNVKQEFDPIDVYYDAQEYQTPQEHNVSEVYPSHQEDQNYDGNDNNGQLKLHIKQEDDGSNYTNTIQQHDECTFPTVHGSDDGDLVGDNSNSDSSEQYHLASPTFHGNNLAVDDGNTDEGEQYYLASPFFGDDSNTGQVEQYDLVTPAVDDHDAIGDDGNNNHEGEQSHLAQSPENGNDDDQLHTPMMLEEIAYNDDVWPTTTHTTSIGDTRQFGHGGAPANDQDDNGGGSERDGNQHEVSMHQEQQEYDMGTNAVEATNDEGVNMDESRQHGLVDEIENQNGGDSQLGSSNDAMERNDGLNSDENYKPIIDWDTPFEISYASMDSDSDIDLDGNLGSLMDVGDRLHDRKTGIRYGDNDSDVEMPTTTTNDNITSATDTIYSDIPPWQPRPFYSTSEDGDGGDSQPESSFIDTDGNDGDNGTVNTHKATETRHGGVESVFGENIQYGLVNEGSLFDDDEDMEDGLAGESGNSEDASVFDKESTFYGDMQPDVADGIESDDEDGDGRCQTSAEALLEDVEESSSCHEPATITAPDDVEESSSHHEPTTITAPDDVEESSSHHEPTTITAPDDDDIEDGLADESGNGTDDADDRTNKTSTEALENDDHPSADNHSATEVTDEGQQDDLIDELEDGDGNEYQLDSDDSGDYPPYNVKSSVDTQGNQHDSTSENNDDEIDQLAQNDDDEDILYISNVNTSTIPTTSQSSKNDECTPTSGKGASPMHVTGNSRKRKVELEDQGSPSLTKDALDTDSARSFEQNISIPESTPSIAKRRRVMPFSRTTSAPTATQTPPTPPSTTVPQRRYFANLSSPPPTKRQQKQSTPEATMTTVAAAQHSDEEKATLLRQLPEKDNVDENADPHTTDSHTRKRRYLPVAAEPAPENVFDHRYQPPMTYREREEKRRRTAESQRQEAKKELPRIVKIEPTAVVNAPHRVMQREQQSRRPIIKAELPSPLSSPSPSAPSPSASSPSAAAASRPDPYAQQQASPRYHRAPSATKGKVYLKWTSDELEALREGLGYFRSRQWRKILTKYTDRFAPGRTNIDLRDKARNEIKRRQMFGLDLDEFHYAL